MKNNQKPEIRFAGFTRDWEERKLSEISEKVTEKNKNNIYSETLTNSAEFGIINQRDFFDKDISNEKNLGGYYVVRPDDFVYNPRISNFAPVGPIKRNKLGRTGVMSPLYYVFRTHDVDKTYLEKYFSSNSWHIFMKLNGDSGARSDRFAIKDSLFREMPIPIPSIEEQTKIGNFLKQLDDTIALHQQELTILKQTKQGFLQKMFPKERESVPEVRFSGFNGDWEKRKLSDIFNILDGDRGKNYPGESDFFESGATLFLDTGNVKKNGFDFTNTKYITKEKTESLRSGKLEIHDFVLTSRGTLGNVAYYDEKTSDKNPSVRINSAMLILRPIARNEVSDEYMASVLRGNIIDEFMSKNHVGSAQPHITKRDFAKVKIGIPSALEEQLKIGNFFKQLDDTITLHQRELDALQETKKAFLQKMFA